MTADVAVMAKGQQVSYRMFPAVPQSVAAARRFTTAVLGECPVSTDAVLVISELVTNAVVHGAGPVTVRLSRRSSGVLCEVSDAGPWAPRAYEPGPGAERGRGLAVVVALAVTFGVRPGACHGDCNGKTVWCFLEGGDA